MKVRFYLNNKGEVLSNVDYPVNKPMLVVPVLRDIPCCARFVDEPDMRSTVDKIVYRAVTIEFDDGA